MKPNGFILIAGLTFCQVTIQAQYSANSCFSNIIISSEKGKDGTNVNFPYQNISEGGDTLTYSPASGSFFRIGSSSVIVTGTSGYRCSFTVTVTDNDPPELSELKIFGNELSGPTVRMKNVRVEYEVKDNSEIVTTSISVSSNSIEKRKDWEIINDHLIRLKTHNLPDGGERVYTIVVAVSDESGNVTTRKKTFSFSQSLAKTERF